MITLCILGALYGAGITTVLYAILLGSEHR